MLEFDDGYDGSDVPQTQVVDDARFRRFMELRVARDETKAKAERAEKAYRAAEQELYSDLKMSSLKSGGKIDLGPPYGEVRFTPRETLYSKVIDPDALMEYLEERAMLDEATTPSFSRKRLNEIVSECVENKQNLPPGLDFSPSYGITVTVQK